MRASRRVWTAAITMAAVVACGGSNGSIGGPGPGSALCGVNGTDHCGGGQECDATLGCVDCETNSNCPQAAPFCVAGLGQCGTCLQNNDCPASAPACWPSDHDCHVACPAGGGCPKNAPTCDTSSGIGVCVGCSSAAPCGNNSICDAATAQCVECAVNSDCPADHPRCLVAEGQCVQCLNNSDCGTASPICDPGQFQCRPGCTSSATCSGDVPLCDTTSSSCVQCLATPTARRNRESSATPSGSASSASRTPIARRPRRSATPARAPSALTRTTAPRGRAAITASVSNHPGDGYRNDTPKENVGYPMRSTSATCSLTWYRPPR